MIVVRPAVEGGALRLRGANARVVQAGTVRRGDVVRLL
jgi:MOSC domain-containing protein YiiM